MATHTFYLTDTLASTPGFFGVLQDGGTPPTAATTGTVIGVGKIAVGQFAKAMSAGGQSGSITSVGSATSIIDSTSGPTAGTGTGNLIGDSYRTPATLTGTFASGTWTLNFGERPTTVQCQGLVRCRVWKSASAGATGPTEITSGAIVGSSTAAMSSTTTTYTSTISWSAPSFTLTNEYLFFQVEWLEQTSAGSASLTKYANRIGSETSIATTDLGAAAAPFMFPRNRHYLRR